MRTNEYSTNIGAHAPFRHWKHISWPTAITVRVKTVARESVLATATNSIRQSQLECAEGGVSAPAAAVTA